MNLEKYNQNVLIDMETKEAKNYKESLKLDSQSFLIKAYFFKIFYFSMLFICLFIYVAANNNNLSMDTLGDGIYYYAIFFYDTLHIQSLSFFTFGLLAGFFAKRINSLEFELVDIGKLKNQNLALLYFFSSILILVYSIFFGFAMEYSYLTFAEDNYKLSNDTFLKQLGKNDNLISGYVFGISNAIIYFKLLTDYYYKSIRKRALIL